MDSPFKVKLPKVLTWIAIVQVFAVVILPPAILASVSPLIWVMLAGVFALLGWNLLRRKSWAGIASIFIQGFSIIARLLVILPNAKLGSSPTSSWNVALLVTSFISIACSAAILYTIDSPEIQALLQ